MKLGAKIVVAALAAITVTVAVSMVVQARTIREQGILLTRETMQAVVAQAESIRHSVASLNEAGAFHREKLLKELNQGTELRSSAIYRTIPIVAAWTSIEESASRNGFEFRVTRTQPRNPKNNPTPAEAAILRSLETTGQKDYFEVDARANQIVYARPIVLSKDCLACHGDPKNSPTGDGKDFLGFAMENWKEGELHGAFILKAGLDKVDAEVKAGLFSTLAWILPITVLIAVLFWWLNRRMIVRPLQVAIAEINSSSTQTLEASAQITSTSTALAEGASEQAASLEETSASLEEISSMVRRNAENAATAKSLANQARTAADSSSVHIDEMNSAMQDIKAASDDIARIVKSIDEIAFQTNILALNAAVEAARAGEAGLGFAVVADEVRGLAQRSALAARETAEKIENSISKSARGVEISARVTSGLQEVAEKIRQVDTLVAEISTASNEQDQGIQQVNKAVGEMDKVTQNNAASAEEGASAAEELKAQATSLQGSIQALLQLVSEQNEGEGTFRGEPGAPVPASRPGPSRQPAPAPRLATPRPASRPPTESTVSAATHPPARPQKALPLPDDFKDF